MDFDLDRLRALVPLDSLGPEALQQLAEGAQLERYPAGTLVFHEGDTDNDFVYLHSGEIKLLSSEGPERIIRARDEQSRYPLANLKPRHYTGVVQSREASFLRVDGSALEHILTWGQISEELPPKVEEGEIDEFQVSLTQDMNWTMALLKTKAFLRLPSVNIEQLFERFQPVVVRAGEVVIRYGDPGDYFYIIQEGRCAVTRPGPSGEIKLAEFTRLDSFGEDALISNHPRNATITMLTDGVLARLSKRDFDLLLKGPLVKWVSLAEAGAMVRKEGAIKIDVRTEKEFAHHAIPGSINIPLYLVRLKAPKLKPNLKYILYCDTGVRSEAAAFILAKLGLDAYVLKGGMTSAMNRLQKGEEGP
jgi:CRP-like cAMP-binding protein